MKKQFLIVILLFLANFIIAQSDLKPGFIITNKNDTIWGTGNISNKQDYCIFQPYNKTEYKKYFPEDIIAFKILNGRFYKSKDLIVYEDKGGVFRKDITILKHNWKFLEYILDGELDLYTIRENGKDRFFIEKASMPLREIIYNKVDVIEKDRKKYNYKDKRYLGLIKTYMTDSPEMFDNIDNIGIINQKSLIRIAEDYHKSICFDKECINYSKSIPKVSLKLEPFTGVNCHNGFYTPQFGMFLNIWRPLKNEKLYFKVGLSYSSIPYLFGSDSLYSGNNYNINIPFYWQYVFGKNKIKPTIGIGFVNGKLETTLQTGIIYSLSDNFELTVNGSIDRVVRLATNLNKKIGHSLMIGCQIKLR